MLDYLVSIIVVFIVSIAFGIILQVPKQYLLHVGVIGAIGRVLYVLVLNSDYSSVYLGTFLATLIITALSHVYARMLKAPVTIFLIASVIAMIPGYQFFLTVYNFVKMKTDLAFDYLFETIILSGAIAVAIFIVDSIFKFSMDYLAKKRCR